MDDAPYEPVRLLTAFGLAAAAGEAWRIDVDPLALTLLLKLGVSARSWWPAADARRAGPRTSAPCAPCVEARLRPARGT